jgi:predicted dehydrogenase
LVVTGRMADGTLASGCFARGTSGLQEIELIGSAGRLAVNCYRFDGWTFSPRGRLPGHLASRLDELRSAALTVQTLVPRRGRGGDYGASFDGLWASFLEAIRAGRCDGPATLQAVGPVVAAVKEGLQSLGSSTAVAGDR